MFKKDVSHLTQFPACHVPLLFHVMLYFGSVKMLSWIGPVACYFNVMVVIYSEKYG